jgi:hypothetical protein
LSLYDVSKREVSEDVFRLKGIELMVTTDEQLAKARAKVAEIGPSVQIKVTWEPMTYRKFIGDEEVTEETDYIKMTKSNTVSDEALPLLRDAGMRAINKGMLIALPTNPAKADPDKQPQEYSRFMVASIKAGLQIDVTDDGGLTSPQIGQLFRCRSGYEEFPRPGESDKGGFKWDWEDTRSTFMRVPVAIVKDFVQPDELREFRYERQDDSSGGAAATTTTSSGAVTDADVQTAVRALGISGKPASLIDSNAISIISGKVAEFRALAVLMPSAQAGSLTAELVNRGLATVTDGTLAVN